MEKYWEKTTANQLLAKIAQNDHKITNNCPQNSYKNQQKRAIVHVELKLTRML